MCQSTEDLIKKKMLDLTSEALKDQKIMGDDVAQKTLNQYLIDERFLRVHFQRLDVNLRELIDKAYQSYKTENQPNPKEYENLHKKVTQDLNELGIPLNVNKLEVLTRNNLDENLPKISLLSSELLYVESKGQYSPELLVYLSNSLNIYDSEDQKKLFNYMKEEAGDEIASRLHHIIDVISNPILLQEFMSSLSQSIKESKPTVSNISSSSHASIATMLAGGNKQKAVESLKQSQMVSTETQPPLESTEVKRSQVTQPPAQPREEPQDDKKNRPGNR